MKHQHPTPEPVHDVLRTSDRWLVHWLNRAPTIAKYQTPVCLARVLSEHHAAVAAEPLET